MAEQQVGTVIGDVVASRGSVDRAELHERLVGALAWANERFVPVVPLRITVGDEFQGAFASVGTALAVTFRLRLLVHPAFDLRHGVGWGTTEVLSEEPRVEDGPGWWAARAAIEAVAHDQSVGARRLLRTAYRLAPEGAGPGEAAINAALIGRDTLLGAAPEPSWGVLRDLLDGMSQQEIAGVRGVSASAVSQRVRRDGLAALVAADELLTEVR